MEKNKGAKGVGKSAVDGVDRTPTLKELGITKDISSRAQTLASIPEKKFEAAHNAEQALSQICPFTACHTSFAPATTPMGIRSDRCYDAPAQHIRVEGRGALH